MQTILIEDNDKLFRLFSLNLNTYAGTDVIERKNAKETTDLLSILPNINLIICRNKIGKEDTAIIIQNFLEEKNLEIPLIVLGNNIELEHRAILLNEPFAWESLIKKAAKVLGISMEDLRKKIRPEFVPVSIKFFSDISEVPCDIYIRIKKGVGDFQFIKRIHSKDKFEMDTIEKYEAQGVNDLYVSSDYQQYFVTFVTNQIIRKLEKEDLDTSARITTTANAYDIVVDQLSLLGLDSSIIELSDSAISSMSKIIKEESNLSQLLKMLFSSKISYAYQRAHLRAVIGNFILSKQKWYDEKYIDILSFASFFSDITLKSEAQHKIHCQEDLDKSTLTEEEKLTVLDHAKEAATILRSHPQFNEYLEMIILQQHGRKDGIGFELDPPEDLYPVSKVFIIADHFIYLMLDPQIPKVKKEVLDIMYSQYSGESFQKLISTLELKIG
jgi:response regulator RpfG family c-di-GMP phosphodiesterase